MSGPIDRKRVAVLAVAVLLASSGCIGFLLGNDSLEFTASNATVSDDALDETGYSLNESHALVENRTLEDAGDREIVVESHVNAYSKRETILDDKREVGRFTAVAVPEVEVLGRSFNPLDDMSNADLLDEFQSQMTASSRDADFSVDEEKRLDGVLGEQVNVTRFTGTTRFNDKEIEVAVYATKVKHDGDWVVMLGAHPTQRPEGEQDIETLMQSLEHDGGD
ncbi:DUF6517 family protein [Halostella sp. PRR32]|uniref:DUF6517 family protein n=1 Tax=Halostella sp. PRR32 TaxID=3098147 RepID=UPI002B1D7B6B|nr:DUF6517 family protein [Halostella sp. PRR32]